MILLLIVVFFVSCGSGNKASSVTSTSSTAAAPPQSIVSSPASVSTDYFGMHVHNPSNWPSLTLGSVRLWDAGVTWPSLEPSRGQWNFATLDKFVSLSEQNKVKLLMTLGLSPQWASARPAESCPYGAGEAAEPQDIQDWRDFVQTVATRYKGQIHEYDVWNEPSDPSFFTGTPAKMLQLAMEAYKILKQVDPTITVVTPGLPGDTGKSWLDTYLALGGGNYADVIGYHFYVNPDPPESITYMVADVQAILKKYGQSAKPLWNTETGWHWPTNFTPAQESAYVARSYILSWGIGVSRFYWYAWDDHDWVSLQLTNADGSLRPSAQALSQVSNWLLNSQISACSPDTSGVWTCQLNPSAGSAHIVWSPNGTLSFSVPGAWNARTMEPLNGTVTQIPTSGMIQIDGSPVLLH